MEVPENCNMARLSQKWRNSEVNNYYCRKKVFPNLSEIFESLLLVIFDYLQIIHCN